MFGSQEQLTQKQHPLGYPYSTPLVPSSSTDPSCTPGYSNAQQQPHQQHSPYDGNSSYKNPELHQNQFKPDIPVQYNHLTVPGSMGDDFFDMTPQPRGRSSTWSQGSLPSNLGVQRPCLTFSRDPSETDVTFLGGNYASSESIHGGGGDGAVSSFRNAWGDDSYAEIIAKAISSAPAKRMMLSQIYEWMIHNIPYFRERADKVASAGWKNSIRHNLSLHKKFIRVNNEVPGLPSWWMLNPEPKPSTKAFRRRTSSMELKPVSEDKREKLLAAKTAAARAAKRLKESGKIGSQTSQISRRSSVASSSFSPISPGSPTLVTAPLAGSLTPVTGEDHTGEPYGDNFPYMGPDITATLEPLYPDLLSSSVIAMDTTVGGVYPPDWSGYLGSGGGCAEGLKTDHNPMDTFSAQDWAAADSDFKFSEDEASATEEIYRELKKSEMELNQDHVYGHLANPLDIYGQNLSGTVSGSMYGTRPPQTGIQRGVPANLSHHPTAINAPPPPKADSLHCDFFHDPFVQNNSCDLTLRPMMGCLSINTTSQTHDRRLSPILGQHRREAQLSSSSSSSGDSPISHRNGGGAAQNSPPISAPPPLYACGFGVATAANNNNLVHVKRETGMCGDNTGGGCEFDFHNVGL